MSECFWLHLVNNILCVDKERLDNFAPSEIFQGNRFRKSCFRQTSVTSFPLQNSL